MVDEGQVDPDICHKFISFDPMYVNRPTSGFTIGGDRRKEWEIGGEGDNYRSRSVRFVAKDGQIGPKWGQIRDF